MKLENNVVKKLLLTPTEYTAEVIEAMDGSNMAQLRDANGEIDVERYNDIIHMCSLKDNKTYYITKSVTEHLELFDTKKAMDGEGWKIFKGLPDFKKTYILPDPEPSYAKYSGSGFLRAWKHGNMLQFLHVTCKFLPPHERTRTVDSSMYIVVLYIDLEKNEMCQHFQSDDGKSLAPFLYSLLCFIELTENEVHIVAPKAKYGTRKAGKIINTLPFPITVVTNTWNVITIRSEGFPVSGHVHLYWTGPGRSIPLMKYVAPYQKDGYTRRSGKELSEPKQL
jgi:hypothetical protein